MMRFEFAVVADLSANVLSACLVIFLVLAGQAAQDSAAREAASAPLPVEEAFRTVLRGTLSGPERVEMLRRSGDETILRLDLHADGVSFGAGMPRANAADFAEALAPPIDGPVHLYVFRNGSYATIVGHLEAEGLAFREITVPDALRNGRNGAEEDWSPAFRDLVDRDLPFAPFASALLDLLEGSSVRAPIGSASAATAVSPVRPDLRERLRAGMALLLSILAPLAGVATVVAIERGHARGEWGPAR